MLPNPFPIPWLDDDQACRHACCEAEPADAMELAFKAAFQSLTTLDPVIDLPYATEAGFDPYESKLAALTADLADDLSEPIVELYQPVLVDGAQSWSDPLQNAHTAARALWTAAAQERLPDFEKTIRSAVLAGEDELDRDRLKIDEFEPIVEPIALLGIGPGNAKLDDIIRAMLASFGFYTDAWFESQIIPFLIREVQSVVETNAGIVAPNFSHVVDLLEARMKETGYWQLLGNATASRGFHYGYLSAGHRRGFREYMFQARLDVKTSDVCRYLHGTRWAIRDVIDAVERSARATTPEEIIDAHPWFVRDRDLYIGDDVANYVAKYIPWPPLHGRCRSTVRIFNRPS